MPKGSRGGSKFGGGGGGAKYTTSDKTVEVIAPHTIRAGYNTDNRDVTHVLEVKALGNGEVSLKENYGEVVGGSRKHPIKEYNVNGASISIEGYGGTSQGVNWNNVKTVSGKTYGIGPIIKPYGFKWNGTKEVWER